MGSKANHQEAAVRSRHKAGDVESREITIAANKYIDDHPEMITFATEHYRDFVKRGLLKPEESQGKQVNE